jgi:2-polyprenyl-3-methyl-5-hydroxy-6-metoxy-1,4-benzoquinol methylase
MDKMEEYQSDYFTADHENWFRNANVRLFERIYMSISKDIEERSVIDVGCGKGDFLRYLRQRSETFILSGVDLTDNPPDENIDFIQGDFLKMKFDKQYDVITSFAVIEHIVDVQEFIGQLAKICKPGGIIIVMTLNDRSILYQVSCFLNKIGFTLPFNRLYSKHHVHHFNVSSLERLVSVSGLKIDELYKHNIPVKAVDMPASSVFRELILKLGVWGTFALGSLMGRTYLQTIFCRKQV